MVRWEWVAIGYVSYLAGVAAMPRFRRARIPASVAAIAAWVFLPSVSTWSTGLPDAVRALVPAPVLLGGYWLSGRFFVAPMHGLERRLQRIDDTILRGTGLLRWMGRGWLAGFLELAYLLVYAVVPAGALALVMTGRCEDLERFWSAVLLAAFASYGALPWIQTRPPRLLENASSPEPVVLRRVNLWLLGRGSIHANTIPSGHAATATAVALAVGTAIPEARPAVLTLAATIVLATVVGRYHFVVDSIAGVVVGLVAWAIV